MDGLIDWWLTGRKTPRECVLISRQIKVSIRQSIHPSTQLTATNSVNTNPSLQSVSQSIKSVNHSINTDVNPSLQTVSQPVSQSSQLINQSIPTPFHPCSQSISQSINQSNNPSTKKSTIYQVLFLYNHLCRSLDRGLTTRAIFFDIYLKLSTESGIVVWYMHLRQLAYAGHCYLGLKIT